MNITNILRKNVGTIMAMFGFLLLCILTFGDLGNITATEYWSSVGNNITSISFMTIGLTLIQLAIKQGLAEQALQRGLNTEHTAQKYEEHKKIIKENMARMIYLPYFLQIYNKRHTEIIRHEFLVNNGFPTEEKLIASGDKRLIKAYHALTINITTSSIKWSAVEIVYNKAGRIITLEEHRARRFKSSLFMSFASMIGTTFLTGGLFFSPSGEPIWQKFVKLFTYIIAIAVSAVFTVVNEYEKGAFGVPNELDEINQIWHEFERWEPPQWVLDEVSYFNEREDKNGKDKRDSDTGANLQEKPENQSCVQNSFSDDMVPVSSPQSAICGIDAKK